MASLTVTPAEVQVGDSVVIDGVGFTPNTLVKITIPEHGFETDTVSDVSGEVNGSALPVKAQATLTLSGNAVAAETVVLNGVTYTWRAAVGSTANEVLIGASASASLDNLKAAVNADPAGSGTLYGSATTAHATVGAGAKTATTLVFYAKTGGTAGNAYGSTETMTNGAFGGATFASGAAAGTTNPVIYTPTRNSNFTVKATDGTNSATTSVRVWTP